MGGAGAGTTAAGTGAAGADVEAVDVAGTGIEVSEAAPDGRVTTGSTVAGGTGVSTRGEPLVETAEDPEVGA